MDTLSEVEMKSDSWEGDNRNNEAKSGCDMKSAEKG